jgi:hypothetical protein
MNRRIGKIELDAIEICGALVCAQIEYATEGAPARDQETVRREDFQRPGDA